MKKLFRRTGVVGAGIVATTAVGIAFAAWTTNGTGTGTASSRDSIDLVVTSGTATDTLYPTGKSDVAVKIENKNEYKVHVSSIVLAAGGIVASDEDCNESSLTYTTQTNGGLGWDIAAGATADLDLLDAIEMNNTANDDCKLNTFTVHLTANGLSAV